MNKTIGKIWIGAGAFLLTFLPYSVLAVELPDVRGSAEHAGRGLPGSNGEGTLAEFVGTLVQGALSVLGVIFFVLLVYGGALWMTAGGDTAKVDKAKKLLTSAIVGLIIVMIAYAIAFYVMSAITASTGIG
ncbi:MAG: hypothetical protein U9Q03_01080 [Patescibacteria group bacterium]|nr:hypothetical protein [Patescibacteria group bacterium]